MGKTWIAGPVLALAVTLWLPLHTFAGGLTVHGGKIESSVVPGKSYSYAMKVENTSVEPMDIVIEVAGYGTSGTSDFIPLDPAKDLSSNSARQMISVAPASFSLTPGAAQDVVAQAQMPAGLPDGGVYAIIFIHTVPAGGAMSTVMAVAARVMLTRENSALNETSSISALRWDEESPLDIAFTLSNAGNHHFKPHINASLTRSGAIVARASYDAQWPLVPGYGRDFSLRLESSAPLPAGEYESRITVTNDSGTIVCDRVESVVIGTAVASPAVPGAVAAVAAGPSLAPAAPRQPPAAEEVTNRKATGATNWPLWTAGALGILVVACTAYMLGRRKADAR
jgi:hypothetical protein